MFNRFRLVFIKAEPFKNAAVALYQLARRKTQRYSRPRGVILYQVHYAVNCPMYRAPRTAVTAKVCTARFFGVLRHVNRVPYKLVNTLVFACRNGNYGYSEQFFHIVYQHRAAVGAHLVHHIERQHHRCIKLHKL